ncbi:MAG TPA: DsbA family oxidoreductase [Thermoleophilaceae bacterium]|jgi:predicted DsbA family dithiol-disulfide isomerase
MEVEIWSDIACPWCYVGKRRFEAALDGFPQRDEVNVTWRSFELDPEAPRERTGDRAEHLAQKYGVTRERALDMQQSMTEAAVGDGLELRFDIARAGNTFDAHRLVHLAASHDLQDAMKERLMSAYLTEGKAIGDPDVLRPLGAEAGLPEAEVRELLTTERFAEEVREDERTAMSLGIQAVPFFVVDRKFGAAGAHPPEVLRQLLERG